MYAIDQKDFDQRCDKHETKVVQEKAAVGAEIQEILKNHINRPPLSEKSCQLLWRIKKQCEEYRPMSIEEGRPEGLLAVANRMLDTSFKTIILWKVFMHPEMQKEIKKAGGRVFKCRKKRQEKCKNYNSCEHSKGCVDKYTSNFLIGKYKPNTVTNQCNFEAEYQEHLDWVLSADDYPLSFENCLLNRDNLTPEHTKRLLKSLDEKPLNELIAAYERYIGADDDFVEHDDDSEWFPVEFEGNVPDTVSFNKITNDDKLAGTTVKEQPKKKVVVKSKPTLNLADTLAALSRSTQRK
jgi:hypothetical protein